MRNNIFTKIIITTLLVTFLTFNVGRVTRVSAVGTVATVAGTALLATGVIYMSYLALTGAEVRLPVADDIELWLKDIGTKVVQYPSGAAAYQDMYEYYAMKDPIANVIDGVWSWTQDRLKSFTNDFANTQLIQDIVSYEVELDVLPPALNYDYPFEFTAQNRVLNVNGTIYPDFSDYFPSSYTYDYPSGTRVILDGNSYFIMFNARTTLTLRNAVRDGIFFVEYNNNGVWTTLNSLDLSIHADVVEYGIRYYLLPQLPAYISTYPMDWFSSQSAQSTYLGTSIYPRLADEILYNYNTGETTEIVDRESTEVVNTPQWNDPDNDNRPIVPWVSIPDLPATIDVPSGYTGIDQWGFNLEDLLDNLSDLGESIFDLAVLKELINSFAGLHGDDYYLYYDNGDTNYYTYYQPTIYEGDYITYNYDISDQDEVMPVNLNEIHLYTDNRYLEQIKHSAIAGSSIVRDFAVFWHDVDPEITYIVLGCCILVLIGAFTGKLGHS